MLFLLCQQKKTMSISKIKSKLITIGSWNVNSIRIRLTLLDAWIKHTSPDIILLQETKVTDEHFPQKFFDDHHYHVTFWGEKSYNGVAIASKTPLKNIQRIGLNGAVQQTRYLQAETPYVRIASVYVPNGKSIDHPSYQDKLDFMAHLSEHVNPYVTKPFPTVLGGDWNIAPRKEDVPDPTRYCNQLLCSRPERQLWEKMINNGWCDSVQTHNNQKNDPTWWDYRQQSWERNRGLRIDAFLVSPWAMDRITHYQVLSEWRNKSSTSDHAPIQIKMWVEDPM